VSIAGKHGYLLSTPNGPRAFLKDTISVIWKRRSNEPERSNARPIYGGVLH